MTNSDYIQCSLSAVRFACSVGESMLSKTKDLFFGKKDEEFSIHRFLKATFVTVALFFLIQTAVSLIVAGIQLLIAVAALVAFAAVVFMENHNLLGSDKKSVTMEKDTPVKKFEVPKEVTLDHYSGNVEKIPSPIRTGFDSFENSEHENSGLINFSMFTDVLDIPSSASQNTVVATSAA